MTYCFHRKGNESAVWDASRGRLIRFDKSGTCMTSDAAEIKTLKNLGYEYDAVEEGGVMICKHCGRKFESWRDGKFHERNCPKKPVDKTAKKEIDPILDDPDENEEIEAVEAVDPVVDEPEEEKFDLETATIAEMKAFAKENGIKITKRKSAEIRAQIEEGLK